MPESTSAAPTVYAFDPEDPVGDFTPLPYAAPDEDVLSDDEPPADDDPAQRGAHHHGRTVQDVLDWCREEMNDPSRNWHFLCMRMARSAWNQPPWATTANGGWARVPHEHRHHTHFSKVPAGAVCFGLFSSWAGHAWISARGDAGFTVDYKRDGHIDRAPVNLPAWTGDEMVFWTDWSPYGMLPLWDDPRNAKLNPHATHKPPAKKPGPKPKPKADDTTVHLSHVKPGSRDDDVTPVRIALAAEFGAPEDPDNWNTFGPATQRQYARWQYLQGLRGGAAGGTPDLGTLTALGRKHGFTVRP